MVPTPQILSSVLTADLSPSRCLVVGLLLTAGCNVLASLAPGDGSTKLVLILAGAAGSGLGHLFLGPKWENGPDFFGPKWTKKGRLAWQSVV